MPRTFPTFLLICAFTPAVASATVYYVDSAAGSDLQNGLSQATPWSTLAHATQTALAPGDYLLLKRGGVWHEPLALASSGSPDLPVTIGAYGTGSSPLIDGSTMPATADLIYFGGKTDVVLDGLQVRNGPWNGIDVNNCARVTIRNFVIAGNHRNGILT